MLVGENILCLCGQISFPIMTDTRRRVKLYALNADRQWDDRGTGHVSSTYVDRLKGTSLLVRAESDGTVLLESKIQPDTAYQKQQVICHISFMQ